MLSSLGLGTLILALLITLGTIYTTLKEWFEHRHYLKTGEPKDYWERN